MILPDANLLIYAYNEASVERKAAHKWLEQVLSNSEAVGFCWQTLTAFLRVSTNKKIFANAYSSDEAIEVIENWLSAPNARLLVPTERHLGIFKRVAAQGQVSGPMLMDAHLAALVIEHGATLATTDRDFRLFDGLKIINPLAA